MVRCENLIGGGIILLCGPAGAGKTAAVRTYVHGVQFPINLIEWKDESIGMEECLELEDFIKNNALYNQNIFDSQNKTFTLNNEERSIVLLEVIIFTLNVI